MGVAYSVYLINIVNGWFMYAFPVKFYIRQFSNTSAFFSFYSNGSRDSFVSENIILYITHNDYYVSHAYAPLMGKGDISTPWNPSDMIIL